MFGLGAGEIVVILIVALLVLGPTQLPNAAKEIGKAIRTLRRHTRDLQDTIEKDENIGGTVRELKSALRGDEYFPREPLLPNKPATSPKDDEKPVAQETVAQAPEPEAASPPLDPALDEGTPSTPPAAETPRNG
jgi:sec-independent protein translocase protein TatB